MEQHKSDSEAASQVIYAPKRPMFKHEKRVFLAGSTAPTGGVPWRETLKAALSRFPVTLLDPYRPDWDRSWVEDINFLPFREQVTWELDMQEAADVVVVYFHPDTQAPVSLLELGLRTPRQKALVVCPPGYWKRGNVQVVCQRYGIRLLESDEMLGRVLVELLGLASL